MDSRAYYGLSSDEKWRSDRPVPRPSFPPATNRHHGSVLGQGSPPGYGDYYNKYNNNNDYWNKDYYQRSEGNYQGWTGTQPGYANSALSAPTSDIGRAMDILKEAAARPAVGSMAAVSPQPTWLGRPRDTYPESTIDVSRPAVGSMAAASPQPTWSVLPRDTYPGSTIDVSRNPGRRYGNTESTIDVSRNPARRYGNPESTIDVSRDPARRYGNPESNIDVSRDPARRYGNFNLSSRPYRASNV